MKIRIDVAGLDELRRSLRDLQTEGIARAQEALDAALDAAAEISRDLAHEHSGALKASQSHSSDHGATHWSGQIAYTAPGASWEIERGGEHAAFIDAVGAATEDDFERAMDKPFENL